MDLTDLLKDLPGGNNMGGLPQKFYIGLQKDVLTWPTKPVTPATIAAAGVLVGDLTMKVGKKLFEVYFTDDSGEFKIEPAGELDGKSFIERLSIFHPGLSATLLGFLNAVKNENLVIIVPDSNGNLYLMGDEMRPAVFSGAPDGIGTGKESAAKRGASMEFTYKTPDVLLYEGSIPLTLGV